MQPAWSVDEAAVTPPRGAVRTSDQVSDAIAVKAPMLSSVSHRARVVTRRLHTH